MYTQAKPDLEIYHTGVMGMKWGHRKAQSSSNSNKKSGGIVKKLGKTVLEDITLTKSVKKDPNDSKLMTFAKQRKAYADSMTFGKAFGKVAVYSALGVIGGLTLRALSGI